MPGKLFTIQDSKEHGPVKASDVNITVSETGLVTITFQLPEHTDIGDVKLPKLDLEVGKNISHKPEKLGARISWKKQDQEATLEVRTALKVVKRDGAN